MDYVTIQDIEMSVWHQNQPSSNGPHTTLGPDVLSTITITTRAADVADEVDIGIVDLNDNSTDLRMGDRVQLDALIGNRGVGYGVSYGVGYGGPIPLSWTGRVKAPAVSREHEGILGSSVSTNATDWIVGILSERNVTGAWVDEDVGAIIRDIVERKASEIDASNVPDLGVTTDLFKNNADAWDTIVSLAARADAITTQNGTELHVTPITGLTKALDLTVDDYRYPWDTDTDDDVKNVIRVDSGTSRQEESSQETQDSYETVTQSSRHTHRLRARKSAIHSVDVWVRDQSDERLVVRLQADEGGSPVAIDDADSDIDSTEWDSNNLPADDFKTFFFNNHTLPDRDPWLILETDGPNGHDVGVDGSGALTHRSYYPHPLSYEDTDNASIAEYGPRELRIERENLDTIAATEAAVQEELARRAWPTKTITFGAASVRAHALEPGHVIGVNNPDENAVGEYIVTEVSHEFDAEASYVSTNITATWRKGVLAT